MLPLNVLVSGASIAGPATAYWLARAGATVTVIERFPELRKGGHNVDLRTSGVTVMRRMPGMEEAVRAALYQIDGIRLVDAKGRYGPVMGATGKSDQQSLLSEYEIFRGDLSRVLVDLTKHNPNIKYIFGEQIASMQQKGDSDGDGGPVLVEFANGMPAAEYDLVVACDGATSRTRAMALGCGVRDHIESLNWWSSFFTIKRDLLEGERIGCMLSFVGGRTLMLAPSDKKGECKGAVGMVYAPKAGENKDSTLQFREMVKQGTEATKAFILKNFGDDDACSGWKTAEVLQGMLESDDFYASEFVQVKCPKYYKGRFAMVGDAGYCPSLGAGTTLALTGAYVLAGEIAAHAGDLTAGLEAYDRRMRPIVDEFQKVPFVIPAAMAPQTEWGIWFRNTVFNILAVFSGLMTRFGSLFGAAFGKDNTGIPEYQFESKSE